MSRPDALHADLLETSERLYHATVSQIQLQMQTEYENFAVAELAKADPEDPDKEATVKHLLHRYRQQLHAHFQKQIHHAELDKRYRDEQILKFHPKSA